MYAIRSYYVTLDHFTYPKEIIIDSAGWSDLLLGVVIGAVKPPDRRYMERRIPTSSFQPPNFKKERNAINGYLMEIGNRITSYNVCYTKLLRIYGTTYPLDCRL